MEYRRLGASDPKVPALGFGAGAFGGRGPLFGARGNLRYVGVSNFAGWQVMKSPAIAERHGHPRYVVNQVYRSRIGRDDEADRMPLGLDRGVGATVWSPLGWGRLTGRIRRGQPLPEVSRLRETARYGPPVDDEYLYRVVGVLDALAEETGRTIPQIASNWLLRRPTLARDHRSAHRGAAVPEHRCGRLVPHARSDRASGHGQRDHRTISALPMLPPRGVRACESPTRVTRRGAREATAHASYATDGLTAGDHRQRLARIAVGCRAPARTYTPASPQRSARCAGMPEPIGGSR